MSERSNPFGTISIGRKDSMGPISVIRRFPLGWANEATSEHTATLLSEAMPGD